MIKSLILISRAYALPMSFFSWLAAFAYGVSKSGNIIYGLIAFVGIALVHLGMNMFDDYIDYKNLKKTDENGKKILINAQKGKCEFLLNGKITEIQLLFLTLVCFFWAFLIGIFFVIKTGFPVLIIMGLTALFGLIYPIAGKFRLCEILIALIYGPLLFLGVDYVMTGVVGWNVLLICVPTMIMTLNLLYTDTMLDYELDKSEGKKTVANLFDFQKTGLFVQKILLIFGYLSIIPIFIKTENVWLFLTYITIPFALNLINSMELFIQDKTTLPKRTILDGLMENWDTILEEGSAGFMMRMYQARNLMVYFSIIYAGALILTN